MTSKEERIERNIREVESLLESSRIVAPELQDTFDFAVAEAYRVGKSVSKRELYLSRIEAQLSIMIHIVKTVKTRIDGGSIRATKDVLNTPQMLQAFLILTMMAKVDQAEERITQLQAKLAMHNLEIPDVVS